METRIITIIVVLYNPTTTMINKWIEIVTNNESLNFVFIDNSENQSTLISNLKCNYVSLGQNKGIAYAQNIGIKVAIDIDSTFIIFFDQDSTIPDGYSDSIVDEYKRIKRHMPNMVMLGPQTVNADTNKVYKNKEIYNEYGFCKMPCLISSGTVTCKDAFNEVGLFEEGLFIDYVDFEWCWRAISKGYSCAKTNRVLLPHKVGSKALSICGYQIIVSAPIRYFYQYRNFLLLINRAYVPYVWKLKNGIRAIIEFFIVPLITGQTFRTFSYMVKGIYHGTFKRFS